MEFITDNYIWFIVGGVVILMAIIGFIAEKTDFGRKKDKEEEEPTETKKEKKKKQKKEKPQPEKEKIEVEVKGIGDISQSITEQMQDALPIENTQTETVSPDLYAGIGDTTPPIEDNTVVDDSLFAPLTSEPVQATPVAETTPIAETAPVVETQTVAEVPAGVQEPVTEPVEAVAELQNIQPAPVVDPIAEATAQPVAEDEDIWKF